MTAMTYTMPESFSDSPINVLLLGVGGTGGEMLDGLTRIHHGLLAFDHPGIHVTAVDPDTVSQSNIGRQRFSPVDVDQSKALTLIHRANLFYGLNWQAHCAFADAESIGESVPDVLITCVDRATVRHNIGEYFADSDYPTLWLDMGNGQHNGQVVLGHLGGYPDVPLRLPNIFDLYPELVAVDDDAAPSCSMAEALASQDLFINRIMADNAATLLWNLIRQGSISHHGMAIDLNNPISMVTPMSIDPESWAFYGYKHN